MESLYISRELGAKQEIAISLTGLGGVAIADLQAERGVQLLGAAEALLEATGGVLAPEDHAEFEQGVTAARAQLDQAAFEKAWAKGRAMDMEQAIEYALDERGDGRQATDAR